MDEETLEHALTFIMGRYLSMDCNLLPDVLGYEIKQEVGRVDGLIFRIQSNDHPPPHFHVIKKDGSLNAKFSIYDCNLIKGEVNSKDLRRIQNWFKDEKVVFLLEVWKKNK